MRAPDQSASASRVLREHWREGRKLTALPPELRPRDRAEGYDIQAEIESQSRFFSSVKAYSVRNLSIIASKASV